VADRLTQFHKTDKEKYVACWPDIEMIIKLGLLQDDKFYEKIKDSLVWKTTKQEWKPLPPDTKKILYSTTENSPLIKLYQEEIFLAITPLDTAVIQFLENKLSITFRRIDGALDDNLLASSQLEDVSLTDLARTALPDVDIEVKNLTSPDLPGLVILDENQRRLRDYIHLTQGTKIDSFKKRFVINSSNPLIQNLSNLPLDLATSLLQSLYDLALLSQKETADLESIIARQTKILMQMASLVKK
jgi:molecular chaperone HtpG